MFAGIVEQVGTVVSFARRGSGAELRIAAAGLDLVLGESIAVDGACLTAVDPRPGSFGADLSSETLERTTLAGCRAGAQVNLERSLRVGDRLGGHFVLGHVDAAGTVASKSGARGSACLVVRYPVRYDSLVVEKGSVAVNGVSLTIAVHGGGRFEVALIPHTLAATNLGRLRAGSRVNLEFDYLAKLVQSSVATLHGARRGRAAGRGRLKP